MALKGRRGGEPLADDGLDKIVSNAKKRAGLAHCTCHELRHTCLTRLREAGHGPGGGPGPGRAPLARLHPVYLHLANDWLAAEYVRAAQIIEASRRDEVQAVAK